MFNCIRPVRGGLGDVLYESATIAYDTTRQMFFNPQTNQDYGPNPPQGGWSIGWYQNAAGDVIAPAGSNVNVADIKQQLQAQAQQQQNTQGTPLTTGSVNTTNQTSANTSPATGQTVSSSMFSVNSDGTYTVFGIPLTRNELLLGGGAIVVGLMMMQGNKRGRY